MVRVVDHQHGVAEAAPDALQPDRVVGGAGVQELIYSLIMMKERFVAPSINIEKLDPLAYGVNIIREAREAIIKMAMSNSFGFGGTNGSIMVAKV